MGLQLLVFTTAAVVVVGLLLAVRDRPDEPDKGAVLGSAVPAAAGVCRDVLLVGVDGGGERPGKGRVFGPTVDRFRTAYAALAAKGGRTVDVRRVPIHADAPRALLRKKAPDGNARKALDKARVKAWRKPVPHVVGRTMKVLTKAAAACPEQQVVLVGFSHGAAVMHRVLLRLANRPDGLARVAAATLIADPDRVAKTSARIVGHPPAPRGGSGVFAHVLTPQADTPAPSATFDVLQVCSRGDLVCAPKDNTVKAALKVARSYHEGRGARAVRRVARSAWSSTALVPIPAPRTQSLSMRIGKPFSAQLVARVKARHGVVWVNAVGLPPGLTLGPTGLLSGTPTQPGAFTFTYQVSGTAPATVPMSGSVSVVVTSSAVSTAVTAGGQSSCATHNDGTLWCWGRNNFGQLGDGTTTPRPTPAPVGTFVDWKQVSASGSTTCGVRADSTLWCWGLNNFGQVGVAGASRSTPVQVGTNATWTSVSTSWFHTCATRSNGSLWCWGANRHGELGLGGINRGYTLPHKVASNTWASVTAGGFHTCATRTDGTAWCWGQSIFGQLGNANPAIQPNPVQVGLLTDWKQLSASWAHTCGLSTAGQLRCWGFNSSGQVGDGTLTTQLAPVPVASDRTWTSISTAESSTCAIDAAGGAWCWGANHYGQLGNGQTTTSLVPSPVPSDLPWVSLTAGWWHGCGVRQGGEAVCWGNNEWGQLGDATLVDAPLPKEVL